MMANLILELRKDQRKEKKKERWKEGWKERERPLMQSFPAVAELERMCTSDLCLAENEYESE